MRKITIKQILVFEALVALALASGSGLSVALYQALGWTLAFDLKAALVFGLLNFATLLLVYRTFLAMAPLPTGDLAFGSRGEFIYHVYILFYLVFFYPVILSGILPIPLRRILYLCLGARLGKNTFPASVVFDPILVEIGDNAIIGAGSLLIPHILETRKLSHEPIVIGNNVTIGVYAVVYGGCVIEDKAIILAHSVLSPGTKVGHGEIWGGVPARKIKDTVPAPRFLKEGTLAIQVKRKIAEDFEEISGTTLDVSTSGIRARLERPARLEGQLQGKISFADEDPILLDLEVVRSTDQNTYAFKVKNTKSEWSDLVNALPPSEMSRGH